MAKSLKDVLQQRQMREERNERPQVDWFSLKNNNPARIKFLQELDPDAPNYDSSRGHAIFLVEHTSPHDFRRRAECTMETEGRCFACEMAKEEPKPKNGSWWPRTNMYIQVFDAKDEKVKVLSRPAPGGFFDTLYEWASDENEGSVVGPTFKISKGSEQTSPWTLMTTSKEIEVPNTVELLDLEKAVGRQVKYEEQRRFYIPEGADEAEETKAAPAEAPPSARQTDDIAW